MQTFRFDAPADTWWIELQLSDLAVALGQEKDLTVSYGLHSVWKWHRRELTISTFWESLGLADRVWAQKADIYLRALGNRLWTQPDVMAQAWKDALDTRFPKLARQLLCAAEDARLARLLAAQRPGTVPALRVRAAAYGRLLEQNRRSRERDGRLADLLFSDVYLMLHDLTPKTTGDWLNSPDMRGFVERVTEARTSADVVAALFSWICAPDFPLPRTNVADTSYDWFAFDFDEAATEVSVQRFVADTPAAAKQQGKLQDAADTDEQRQEQLEIWTQEQNTRASAAYAMENQENQSVPHATGGAREGDDNPDSVIVRRGRADAGVHPDSGEPEENTDVQLVREMGDDVLAVGVKVVPRGLPDSSAEDKVRAWAASTRMASRKLVKLFHRVLLHEMRARQQNTRHGRLDKRLTRLVTEQNPRLFYHKSDANQRFDVAVQLLVDCSGSMYERLEGMKPTLFLFHDTLRQLGIPHDVCGFWEDTIHTATASATQPVTHLLHVITFQDGMQKDVARYLDLLQPQLDNRDGHAIRLVGQQLYARQERQKWLLVVSDGEPAAENYRDAVKDTKNAIRWLQAKGIYVMHLCLAHADDLQTLETLKQLYGAGCVVVRDVDEFPVAMERALALMIRTTI
ncbi:cobaltochelatase CobT-related protein [Alicyclobacillus suci]|uniref:cobaltochelatase CobT-related protein n=1 Tax=Alicyclobacillus suci TaxID=2816080 RepID=UPI001A8C0495|nr:hypothetical protein [Alicyclobacillus suci]